MKARYYVALNSAGQPVAQRSTLRPRAYLSASYDGGSFSSRPPDGAYPLRVIEVPKALIWVARATLEDGTKVAAESSSYAYPAGLFIRYTYQCGRERMTDDTWTRETEAEWRARYPDHEVVALAPSTVELRRWPVAPVAGSPA